ncbi:MAG: tripartite tricarboxylate transporter substrate binding protein [Pseudothermotoga sp.]
MRRLSVLLLILVTVFVLAAYPDKPITFIIQAAPGGASDMTSRTITAIAQEILGVPITCTNITGASGAIAMKKLQTSKPDGYTMGYVPVELSMVKALGFADFGPEDFDLLMRIMVIPAAVTVRSNAPWKTIQEFIDYVKSHPGTVTVGNSGPGSIWHIAALSLEKAIGTKLVHVPFDGAAPAVAALMGGHITAVTVSPTEVRSGVESGQLRILAVLSDERSPLFPDVPALKELGYDVSVAAWGGLALPKGVDPQVYKTLADAFKKAYDSEEFQKFLKDRGMTPAYLDGEQFKAFAIAQYNMYMEFIPKALGK